MAEKRNKMVAKQQANVEKAGTWRDGQKVQFVNELKNLEMQDYIAAKKISDAKEAADAEAEKKNEEQRKLKLKQTQKDNF